MLNERERRDGRVGCGEHHVGHEPTCGFRGSKFQVSQTSDLEHFSISLLPPVLRGLLGPHHGRNFGMVGMICSLHPRQASRALLDPDIARRQSKWIDQQRIQFFPS